MQSLCHAQPSGIAGDGSLGCPFLVRKPALCPATVKRSAIDGDASASWFVRLSAPPSIDYTRRFAWPRVDTPCLMFANGSA
jgi:hypothetical protein